MRMTKYLYFLLPALLVMSCKSDDNDIQTVPPRVLSEVAAENDVEIQTFLRTHFYNYEQFQTPPAGFDFKIVIDTIEGENADKTPLIEQVESNTIPISSSDFLLTGEENVPHTYYYVVAREGAGTKPTVGDSTFVRFKGASLNNGRLNVFDELATGGTWFDLPVFQIPGNGSARAFRGAGEGLLQLQPGGNIVTNPDGTFEVEDFGIGMIIFPSGLGTFNGFRSSIPQYAPLVFTFDLLLTEQGDHDNDGIPSFMEDVNGDGLLFNDNTDGDRDQTGAQISNYLDPDDDEDGTPTRDEIIINPDGTISFPDTDGDGTPDYLDPDNS